MLLQGELKGREGIHQKASYGKQAICLVFMTVAFACIWVLYSTIKGYLLILETIERPYDPPARARLAFFFFRLIFSPLSEAKNTSSHKSHIPL